MEIPKSLESFAEPPTWKDLIKNLIFIAVAVGVAYFVTVRIGIDDIRASVESAGIFAPLIIVFLKATTIVVVPLGGTPLYPIAGALYGFWPALGITLMGDAIGSAIAFYLSRFFGKKILHFFMARNHMSMVEKLVEKASDTKVFLKARIFFTGFPELFAYAAGLTKIRMPVFLVIHVGIHAIPASLLVVFGNLLVAGNMKTILLVGLVSTLLAFGGIVWFHLNLTKGN
ncbi:MAG TPA: VTT domain-containing protein [Candidatus Paceibacterota bacterium]